MVLFCVMVFYSVPFPMVICSAFFPSAFYSAPFPMALFRAMQVAADWMVGPLCFRMAAPCCARAMVTVRPGARRGPVNYRHIPFTAWLLLFPAARRGPVKNSRLQDIAAPNFL